MHNTVRVYVLNSGNCSLKNHIGMCASYTTAWKYLKALTNEARYLETISGHWIWAYDNLNLKQHIRHEREGKSCTCY